MFRAFILRLDHWLRSGVFIKLGILTTFLCTPLWMKFSNPPKPFTRYYILGFVITLPLIWTISWWGVSGMPGLKAVLKDRRRSLWVLIILLLSLWIFASQYWAFVRETHPEATIGVVLQFCLLAVFVVCVISTEFPVHWLTRILVISLLVHSIIGALQVIQQSSIGLQAFGEIVLNPEQSGISVIQSGVLRWLRPYGLLPHPNIFGGFLVIGLLATSPVILSQYDKIRWLGTSIFLLGFWVLLLTFSRGAWLGFLAGAIILLVLLLRYRAIPDAAIRHIKITLIMAVVMTLCFGLIYRNLLMPRFGLSEEHTEIRSVNERIVLIEIANLVIKQYPIQGVGAGNFPWYASHYLFYETDYDMRGQNVHVVFLLVQTEYGIVGLGLAVAAFALGLRVVLGKNSSDSNGLHRYALVSGVVAFIVIGLFDHYPWSILQIQILWWGALAVAGSGIAVSNSAESDIEDIG